MIYRISGAAFFILYAIQAGLTQSTSLLAIVALIAGIALAVGV